MIGDIDRWTQWLKEKAAFFLLWRLCLYITVAYGWWWMRNRVIQRENQRVVLQVNQQVIQRKVPVPEENPKEDEQQAKARFIRIEISTVCVLLLLEWCHGFA